MKMIQVSKKLGYVKAYKAKDHYYGFVPISIEVDVMSDLGVQGDKSKKEISPISNSNTMSNR